MQKVIERIGENEKKYVLEVLSKQFRSSAGSHMTKQLEELFAEKFNSKFAISFANGTATMHAALAAKGIKAGDEVIVPPLTMSATCFAVYHCGATPVFADIDPNTWTISPDAIEKCVTPRTKAIIPVSIYGLAPDMDGIMAIAQKHNLFVLEDDAQCFLGYYNGRVIGSIGHASSFSFQSSKHITSGEGGMVTTNDPDLADKIRRINSLGYGAVGAAAGKSKITRDTIQNPDYERHVSVGFNFRLAELCSAVALAQVERLETLVDFRIQCAKLYEQALGSCKWLVPQTTPAGCIHSYWTYVLNLKNDGSFSWFDFRNKYKELGGDGVYACWKLNYLEPALRDQKLTEGQWQEFHQGLCPVAESIQPHLLQFKTNYFDLNIAEKKAEALAKTIDYFSR